MKKINKEELDTFLRKHKLWLMDDPDGEPADLRRADLQGADLQGADLQRADLRGADLQGADLQGADLQRADLRGAGLQRADLQGAYLRGADLQRADLQRAYLREAYLRWAYLQGADLQGADLQGAYLREADLRGADLQGADLRRADLQGADLQGADLRGADLRGAEALHVPLTCPEEGEFIGFKKARNYIVKLKITEDAKRSSATGRKCRCSKAIVLSITNIDGTEAGITEIESGYDKNFIYKVGETVEVADFCEDRFNECAAGIHFFITRMEAEEY